MIASTEDVANTLCKNINWEQKKDSNRFPTPQKFMKEHLRKHKNMWNDIPRKDIHDTILVCLLIDIQVMPRNWSITKNVIL